MRVGLFLCFLFLLCVDGAVLRYQVSTINAEDMAYLSDNHWALYNNDVFPRGNISFVSMYDNSPIFESINISSPFFSYDSVSWYVSSDGFLSPTPVPLCEFFCNEKGMDTLFGYYNFGPKIHDGGGNWPMIGLYVMDLDPSAGAQGSVRVLGIAGETSSTDRVIVEYHDVSPSGATDFENKLTSQVEVWSNGTIIMRYKWFPTYSDSPYELSPSVGLVLSEHERHVVNTPTSENGIVAIRFEPHLDACSVHKNETLCVRAHPEDCGWCGATGKCLSTMVAVKSCPRKSFRTAFHSAFEGVDEFYSIDIRYNEFMVDISSLSNYVRVSSRGHSMPLPLGFDFPFFTKNQKSHVTSTVHLLSSGAVSVFSPDQACGPIWNVCPNGNYSFTIMPFVTAARWTQNTNVLFAPLPRRSHGAAYCDDFACPAGIVVEINGIESISTSSRRYAYQIYMDASGAVEMRYGNVFDAKGTYVVPSENLFAHPPPFVGLIRRRFDEGASATVPPPLVRRGARLRFHPIGMCNDCGRNGKCLLDKEACVCEPGAVGEFCESCAPGFYGPSCLPCPECKNGGRCDDGVSGSGSCRCVGLFSGRDCSVLCAAAFDCAHCNPSGGHCECGTCVCNASAGWSGPNCDVPNDPCRRLSFDGCRTCSLTTRYGCAFCFDSACYSTALEGTPNEYTCSRRMHLGDNLLCKPIKQTVVVKKDFGYITLIVFVSSGVLCCFATAIMVWLVIKTRNVYDMHIVGAVGGAFNHHPTRQEREIVRVHCVDASRAQRSGRLVLGIPLKQIPLKKLYENQRDARAGRRN